MLPSSADPWRAGGRAAACSCTCALKLHPPPPSYPPVADLKNGELGLLGELLLALLRGGVLLAVGLQQHCARALLEAVAGALAVPDAAGEGVLLAHPVARHRL